MGWCCALLFVNVGGLHLFLFGLLVHLLTTVTTLLLSLLLIRTKVFGVVGVLGDLSVALLLSWLFLVSVVGLVCW